MRLTITGLFKGRKVAAPKPIFFQVEMPKEDPPEIVVRIERFDREPVQEAPTVSGYCCILHYRDSAGRVSVRRVTCQQYSVAGGVSYLRAYCHERNALRQFRADRIIEMVDIVTGELLDVAAFLGDHAPTERRDTKLTWGLSVRRRADLIAGLNVLSFLAKCDKEWHELEAEVIEEFVSRLWMRCEWPGEPPVREMVEYSRRLAPQGEDFYVGLSRCLENPTIARLMRPTIRALIEADGKITKEESYWGMQVDALFAEAAQSSGR